MNSVLPIFVLIGSAFHCPGPIEKTEDQLNYILQEVINFFGKTVECFRGTLTHGSDFFKLPSFDPLELDYLEIDLGTFGVMGVSGTIIITDLTATNIVNFVKERINGRIDYLPARFTFEIDLLFENPTIDTDYTADIVSETGDCEIWGDGHLSLTAANFRVQFYLSITLLGGVETSKFSALISCEGLENFSITGVRGDDELSAEISEEGLKNGSYYLDLVARRINEVIVEAIHNYSGDENGDIFENILALYLDCVESSYGGECGDFL